MVNSAAHRITSPFIPMVDPNDDSWCAGVKNFLNGYYYEGPIRYVKLTIGRNERACRYEEKIEEPRVSQLAEKVALAFTLVVPLLAGVALLYNLLDRTFHYYSYIPASRTHVPPAQVLEPVEKRQPTIPTEKNLPFASFLATFIANKRLFGDFSVDEWSLMIREYKNYLNDNQKFLSEMVLLKKELLLWRPELLEKPLTIAKETFVESQVTELLTLPITELGLDRLKGVREIECAFDSLIINRSRHFLSRAAPISKEEMGAFISSHLVFAQHDNFIKVLAQQANAEQTLSIATLLKEQRVDPSYRLFLEELLSLSREPLKLANGLAPFWQILQTKVGPIVINYQATFWVHLLGFIRTEEMPNVLSAVPESLPEPDKKYLVHQILAMWALRRHEYDFEKLKETAKQMLLATPTLRPFVQ